MSSGRTIALRIWDVVITAASALAALDIPARLVMGNYRGGEELTDWIITAIFCADLLVRHGRREAGFRAEGAEKIDPRWLAIDIVAALPFHLLGVGSPLQLLRLLKLARVAQFMSRWRRRTILNANKLRLVFFVFWLALTAHWIACGWLALRNADGTPVSWESYQRGLYWCVTTLTTVGYGDVTPANSAQTFYAMLVMIIGVGVYGYVIGNVANLLANIDPARAEYLAHMERLNSFMRYRNLPPSLQRRISDYYDYVWEKRLSYDETEIISALPPGLGEEVSLFLKRDIIQKVPLFKEAEESFLRAIAMQLRPVVYLPGDYVIRAGETGREMFFINRGTVEVVSRDGETVYTTHTDGDFFGEIALFEGVPRTASVRTTSYCDLYRLDKEMFDHVLANYPTIAAHIESLVRERRVRGG
jgi:voltage-gated potassium channel